MNENNKSTALFPGIRYIIQPRHTDIWHYPENRTFGQVPQIVTYYPKT